MKLLQLIALLCLPLALAAGDALPTDSALRTGALPCGLTYYIRHADSPKGRAEMWLVSRTGAIVERDDEQGYAHLLEHMAFNGSEHFPDHDIVSRFTAHGMTYGGDINASTDYDAIRYQFSNVPTDGWTVADSVLLALRDISENLTLDAEKIEKEKHIVEEERNHHGGYAMRALDNALPTLLGNSPYATRMPIGRTATVMAASGESLAEFYRRWFRPDLQAVVIVGDLDAGAMEQHLRRAFASAKRPDTKQPTTQASAALPDGLTLATYADGEALHTAVHLYFPAPGWRSNTTTALREHVAQQLVAMMLNQRLRALVLTRGEPVEATATLDELLTVRGSNALSVTAVSGDDSPMATLTALVTEVNRARRQGFTTPEIVAATAAMRSQTLQSRRQAARHGSRDYAEEYIDHYLHGGYIPGVTAECDYILKALEQTDSASLLKVVRSMTDPKSFAILIDGPDATTMPTERQVRDLARDIFSQSTTKPPVVPDCLARPILTARPTPGSIDGEASDPETGAITLHLSNGATALLLPTNYSDDEILFAATRPGGTGSGGDATSLRLLDDVVEHCALGQWSNLDLRHRLASGSTQLHYSIADDSDNLLGCCRKSDLTTLLELNYLYFTGARPDSTTFAALKRRLIAQAREHRRDPESALADSIATTIYAHNPLHISPGDREIEAADFGSIVALYNRRMANAAQYTFIIVGDFDPDSTRLLVERYIASLPAGDAATVATTPSPLAQGDVNCVFVTRMAQPKSAVYACMMGPAQCDARSQVLIEMAGQVMTTALTARLREEMRATYSVDAAGALSPLSDKWMLSTHYTTEPERTQATLEAVTEAFAIIMGYGVQDHLVTTIKAQMHKQALADERTNEHWLALLRERALGRSLLSGRREAIEAVTPDVFNTFITTLSPTTRAFVVQQAARY